MNASNAQCLITNSSLVAFRDYDLTCSSAGGLRIRDRGNAFAIKQEFDTSGNINFPTGNVSITNNLTVSGMTASLPVKTNASKQLVAAAINLASSEITGVLGVANGGTGGVTLVNSVTGTVNQVTASPTTGAVVLTLPQNIHTAAGPTFASLILSNTTNQIRLGTTNTTTISATAPAASRTYTIPDSGANSSFIMSDGTQTVNGDKTFTNAVTISTAARLNLFSTGYSIRAESSALRFYVNGGASSMLNLDNNALISTAFPIRTTSNIGFTSGSFSSIVTASAQAADRTITIPTVASDANFILSESTQRVNGNKQFANNTGFGLANGTVFTPLSSVDIGGGANGDGITGLTNQLSLQWGATLGGFRHYLRSRHNSVASSNLNAIDFFLNNSITAGGSSAPGTGNVNAMSVTAVGVGVNNSLPSYALDVSGTIFSNSELRVSNARIQTAASSATIYTIPNVAASNFVMTPGTQTISGLKTFNDGISMLNSSISGYDAKTLQVYESNTFSLTIKGPWATTSIFVRFVRIGDVVSCRIPLYSATATSSAPIEITDIPSKFNPTSTTSSATYFVRVVSHGTVAQGRLVLTNVASILIYSNLTTGNFTTGTCGFDNDIYITWLIGSLTPTV